MIFYELWEEFVRKAVWILLEKNLVLVRIGGKALCKQNEAQELNLATDAKNFIASSRTVRCGLP